jgi:hypothetical protein
LNLNSIRRGCGASFAGDGLLPAGECSLRLLPHAEFDGETVI